MDICERVCDVGGAVRPVSFVQANDDAGHLALSAPDQPKPVLRDVAAYDVTVRAGRSLGDDCYLMSMPYEFWRKG